MVKDETTVAFLNESVSNSVSRFSFLMCELLRSLPGSLVPAVTSLLLSTAHIRWKGHGPCKKCANSEKGIEIGRAHV